MKSLFTVLLGLLTVCIMAAVCANLHRTEIENDLTARTLQSLAAGGLADVHAAAEGQIVTLTGRVASSGDKRRAAARAAEVWGVEQVVNQLAVEGADMAPADKAAARQCQKSFDALLGEPIRFAPGKADIARDSFPLLNQLAEAAAACPAARFDIGQPADAGGLAQRRAEAVQTFLAGLGVDARRMAPHSAEDNRPTLFRVKGIE